MICEPGDYIDFRHPDVPLKEIQAAVIEDQGDNVEVMSTLLIPFKHSGIFDKARMTGTVVVHPAAVAVPQESRRDWMPGQMLTTDDDEGCLVAAFDGVVACKHKSGQYLTGGVSFFKAKGEPQ